MTTEQEIVYSIINTLRGGRTDNSEKISERLIRSWIISERSEMLLNFTDNGRSVPDLIYQYLGTLTFSQVSGKEYKAKLPKIIWFGRRTGIRIAHQGEVVGMILKSQQKTYLKDPYMNNVRRAWVVNDYLHVYLPYIGPTVDLTIDAVLHDPSDDVNYNWKTSDFPFPPELISGLKQRVLSKEAPIVTPGIEDRTNNLVSDAREPILPSQRNVREQ